MTALTTPIPAGANVAEIIDGKAFNRVIPCKADGSADTFYPATQPVSGNVGITGAVAVTGAFYQATQPISVTALPLPAGAATETKLETVRALLAGTLTVALPAGAATAARQDSLKASIDAQGPTDDISPVTPSDSTALSTVPVSLIVLSAGNVVVKGSSGTPTTFTGLVAGQIIPLRARYVMATGTTATVGRLG